MENSGNEDGEKKEKIPEADALDSSSHDSDLANVDNRVQETMETSVKNANEKKAETQQSKEIQTDDIDVESTEQLKMQLDTLMNSLATLSAEKSKMEEKFQMDRKQLRSEREECEKVIKDLREQLKKAQNHNYSEVEHVKCKLIMERHEREKEQADHARMLKELQKLLHEERRNKEQLEAQMKILFAHKTQCKILEVELEITKNKLKQAEEAAKEAPPILLSLQSEMTLMKKQHLNAIHEEQKRAAAAEQQARALAMTHEARVAGLEARLAELSEIVGGYDRLRQQDQQAIQKLKDQLVSLQENEHNESYQGNNQPEELIYKIKSLYTRLLDLDNKKSESAHVKSLLNSLGLYEKQENVDYKKKYDSLAREFEEFKQQLSHRYSMPQNVHQQTQNLPMSYEKSNSKTQLHNLASQNSNLEDRIRKLNNEIMNKETELQSKLEHQQRLFHEERQKLENMLVQKNNEFRAKVSNLEQQLLRQRERSMALVEEKDKEILTLKTSFHALIPKKDNTLGSKKDSSTLAESKTEISRHEISGEPVADLMTGLLNSDSPPILHYTQELARKEVQVSSSRKRIIELEAALRETQREIMQMKSKQKEEASSLHAHITRLEACKSREGANLEYLKNVFINYLTTNDSSSKRHMLNAIATVLRFTPDELNKIKH